MDTVTLTLPRLTRETAPSTRPSFGVEPFVGVGRNVTVLAVHHVRVGPHNLAGGAEKHLLTAIDALLESGAAVHVAYSGQNLYDNLLSHPACDRLTLERTDWLNPALSGDARLSLSTILSRRRWFRQRGVDTVYVVQQAGGGAFAASIVAARTLGMRVVMSVRQQPQPLPAPMPNRWLGVFPTPQLWRRRLVWRRRIPAICCDAIVFNSARVAEAYRDTYAWPADRFRVIPNGEWPRPARSYDGRRGARRIVCVGRVTQAKGADLVFDAFGLLAGGDPEATLTYFGDGPLVNPLARRAVECGLVDRVLFAGYQEDREAIYRDADLLVQLSRREAMANCVIEAMARGVPCVVSDVGGLPEAVEHGRTGWVVPTENPVAAAHALRQLMADRRVWMRMGLASSRRVAEHFDIRGRMRTLVDCILGNTPVTPG
jgi:glycosyltransferase involved in cell wall biosynthesis